MRICVYGAGATGGHFAARLAKAGHEVSVIARGAHLEAMRAGGLTVKSGDTIIRAQVTAAGKAHDLSRQDVVIVGVKATGLKPVAEDIAPLLSPETLVVFPQNGIPWWYAHGLSSHLPRPPSLPHFALADLFLRVLSKEQVAGGLIYSANQLEAPGVVRNNSPERNRLEIGAIGEREPASIGALRDALIAAGVGSPPPRDIREAVWQKLLFNMSGSSIGLATGNKSSISRDDPALSEIYRRIMREGMAIAAAHGFPLDDRIDPERAIAQIADHKASILQDYESRRPMEIGEMIVAPAAFARVAGVPTPTLDALAAITTRLARDRGLYPVA